MRTTAFEMNGLFGLECVSCLLMIWGWCRCSWSRKLSRELNVGGFAKTAATFGIGAKSLGKEAEKEPEEQLVLAEAGGWPWLAMNLHMQQTGGVPS
ncbi:hypothetical protein Droror1_Dr00008534 [Drosera rotundifolia]